MAIHKEGKRIIPIALFFLAVLDATIYILINHFSGALHPVFVEKASELNARITVKLGLNQAGGQILITTL